MHEKIKFLIQNLPAILIFVFISAFIPPGHVQALIFGVVFIISPSFLMVYFSKKFLKNFEKNEKYVSTLIFVHPKIKESFKIMFITCFIFGVMWTLSAIDVYIRILHRLAFYLTVFSTYLVLLSFVYFFKTLYEITK
jgi:hypothetical protein